MTTRKARGRAHIRITRRIAAVFGATAAMELASCSAPAEAVRPPAAPCAESLRSDDTSPAVTSGAREAGVQVVLYHDLLDRYSQQALLQVAKEASHYPPDALRVTIKQLPQARTGALAQTALSALEAECSAKGGYLRYASSGQVKGSRGEAPAEAPPCDPAATLRADMDSALALGAYAAPALFVNGQRVDDFDSDVLMQVFANEARRTQGPLLASAFERSGELCGTRVGRGSEALAAAPTKPGDEDNLFAPDTLAAIPVGPDDRALGASAAPVTLVGFFCLDGTDCQQEFLRARRLQAVFGNDQVRLVWKDLPRSDESRLVHERAWKEGGGSPAAAWLALRDALFAPPLPRAARVEGQLADSLLALLDTEASKSVLYLDEELALARRLRIHAPGALYANGRPLPHDFHDAVRVLEAEWRAARRQRRHLPAGESLYVARCEANARHLRAEIDRRPLASTPWATYATEASASPPRRHLDAAARLAHLQEVLAQLASRDKAPPP